MNWRVERAPAKSRPGQLNVGSGGVGTTQHIASEVFKAATGIRLVHVPYKGSVLAIADVLAGQIDMTFGDMAPVVTHLG